MVTEPCRLRRKKQIECILGPRDLTFNTWFFNKDRLRAWTHYPVVAGRMGTEIGRKGATIQDSGVLPTRLSDLGGRERWGSGVLSGLVGGGGGGVSSNNSDDGKEHM